MYQLATKDFSKVQESRIADYLDWKVVSGSGARDFNPGDIESDEWLGECKTHVKPTSTIVFYRTVWDKISNEAESKFKYPALFVDCGTQKVNDTWVMFDLNKVQPANCVLISTSIIKTGVNVRFDSTQLGKHYRRVLHDTDDDSKFIVISTAMGDKYPLGILPLTAFVDMVN